MPVLITTERFVVEDGSATLEIPIEDAYTPNLNIQVDLVGEVPRSDDQGEILPDVPPRPAYASGFLNLPIPPLSRTLKLEVIPRETALEPGGETTVFVALKDSAGQPVPNAELAVVVVDEAILALTNYQLTDPISVFYTHRPSDVRSHYSRSSIVLVDPQSLANEVSNAQQVVLEKEMEADAEMAGTALLHERLCPEALPRRNRQVRQHARRGQDPLLRLLPGRHLARATVHRDEGVQSLQGRGLAEIPARERNPGAEARREDGPLVAGTGWRATRAASIRVVISVPGVEQAGGPERHHQDHEEGNREGNLRSPRPG